MDVFAGSRAVHQPQHFQNPAPSHHLRKLAAARAQRHRDASVGVGKIADDRTMGRIRHHGVAEKTRDFATLSIGFEQPFQPNHRIPVAGAGGTFNSDNLATRKAQEQKFGHCQKEKALWLITKAASTVSEHQHHVARRDPP
jgi:hypothetical protein